MTQIFICQGMLTPALSSSAAGSGTEQTSERLRKQYLRELRRVSDEFVTAAESRRHATGMSLTD
ncbi:MAG: hypothetical protein R2758_16785 [Bacteroidales bacterium]